MQARASLASCIPSTTSPAGAGVQAGGVLGERPDGVDEQVVERERVRLGELEVDGAPHRGAGLPSGLQRRQGGDD
jgi:hypothetical protein